MGQKGEAHPITRAAAQLKHWTDADYQQHVQMGFDEGWGKATDQMEALLAKLK